MHWKIGKLYECSTLILLAGPIYVARGSSYVWNNYVRKF